MRRLTSTIRISIETRKKLEELITEAAKYFGKRIKETTYDDVIKYLLERTKKKRQNNSGTFSEDVLEELDVLAESLGKDRNEVVRLLLRAIRPEMLASVEEGLE